MKFIVVEEDFKEDTVPQDYTLINMKYKGDSFKTLVPQSLLFYMVNPGEGNIDDALDEISDFYRNIEDFEDELIEKNESSVQEVNWAMLSRESYQTYIINKLVRDKTYDEDDKNSGQVPEFNPDILHGLDINDEYVANRLRAIAAVSLGKTAKEVKNYGVGDVLKHVTVKKEKVTKLSKKEFDKITCWSGSHYEIKPEYRNKKDVKYEINHRHVRSYKVGTKKIKKKEVPVFDAKIAELESEIEQYRGKKHENLGKHDKALIRQYINLAHIASENPNAQLDIKPPTKEKIEYRR
jgi:predicted small secreted protein